MSTTTATGADGSGAADAGSSPSASRDPTTELGERLFGLLVCGRDRIADLGVGLPQPGTVTPRLIARDTSRCWTASCRSRSIPRRSALGVGRPHRGGLAGRQRRHALGEHLGGRRLQQRPSRRQVGRGATAGQPAHRYRQHHSASSPSRPSDSGTTAPTVPPSSSEPLRPGNGREAPAFTPTPTVATTTANGTAQSRPAGNQAGHRPPRTPRPQRRRHVMPRHRRPNPHSATLATSAPPYDGAGSRLDPVSSATPRTDTGATDTRRPGGQA
jgi:hypothetical protein